MSNFTTLQSTPETLSAAPTEQEVKAEPQIDALASSEAQPANTSPSAGKDGSPSAIHRCRRCGENVKSVQFHQRTVHQKRCVIVFPDGTRDTIIRPADGERFTCSKCSYGHRDPQYLQIHARHKCSGQPPEGGLKPETPRRKRRKTMQNSEETDVRDASMPGDTYQVAKQGDSLASGPTSQTVHPPFEMPSIETIDRSRSASASPSLSELQPSLAEDLGTTTSRRRVSNVSSSADIRDDADATMDNEFPETPPAAAAASTSAPTSPEHESPSPSPALTNTAQPSTGASNRGSPMDTAQTSLASSHASLKVHTTDHLSPEARVAQQPTPTSSIPASPLLPQSTEDITGRFALVPAFPLPSTSAIAITGPTTVPLQAVQHPLPASRRTDGGRSLSASSSSSSSSSSAHRDSCVSCGRPPPQRPVDAFLRGLSSTMAPPPHVAQAFLDLGYDTDELLDALAHGSPGEGDWDLLEKEILVDKRYHAWWILVKNGLRARRMAHCRDWAG